MQGGGEEVGGEVEERDREMQQQEKLGKVE